MGWDHPDTARSYARFCDRHGRYRRANEALVAHAALREGHTVLDLAAGIGGTAMAALPFVGASGRIVCVEPASAMRRIGMRRLQDPRVVWTDTLGSIEQTARHRRFDRILCGAAIWQLLPFADTIARLIAVLGDNGALCFNIPALYLGQPDEPGGGADPYLVQLPALVERSANTVPVRPIAAEDNHLPRTAGDMNALLSLAGLRTEQWEFRTRFSQAAYRDWLAIPVVSDGLFAGLPLSERARRLSQAYLQSDRRSWRWERWLGWTAWRRP